MMKCDEKTAVIYRIFVVSSATRNFFATFSANLICWMLYEELFST